MQYGLTSMISATEKEIGAHYGLDCTTENGNRRRRDFVLPKEDELSGKCGIYSATRYDEQFTGPSSKPPSFDPIGELLHGQFTLLIEC